MHGEITFAMFDIYRYPLRESDYAILRIYSAYYGCENFDFPESFKEKGNLYVMTREEVFALFDEIRFRKTSFMKIDFADIKTKGIATLVFNGASINTYKNDGPSFAIPQCHKSKP